MIQICYYNGCGVVYGEKKPLSDKNASHGLCPKHLEVSLKEIKAEVEKISAEKDECKCKPCVSKSLLSSGGTINGDGSRHKTHREP
jgi:hypothetical protein